MSGVALGLIEGNILFVGGVTDCMLKLIHNPELQERLGKAGHERMVQEFDTQEQISKLQAVLLRGCKKSLKIITNFIG